MKDRVSALIAPTSEEGKQRRQSAVELIEQTTIPQGRSHIKPVFERRKYRNKIQWVVGYSWARPASTFYGRVYDCILGAGETPELALERANQKTSTVTTQKK